MNEMIAGQIIEIFVATKGKERSWTFKEVDFIDSPTIEKYPIREIADNTWRTFVVTSVYGHHVFSREYLAGGEICITYWDKVEFRTQIFL